MCWMKGKRVRSDEIQFGLIKKDVELKSVTVNHLLWHNNRSSKENI